MCPEGWDSPVGAMHTCKVPGVSTQLSGSSSPSPTHHRLTGHLQAVPELGDTGHVGGHAAVAAGVGELGTLDLQVLPILGQSPAWSGRERILALVPGDVWREVESQAVRSNADAPLIEGTQEKPQRRVSKS